MYQIFAMHISGIFKIGRKIRITKNLQVIFTDWEKVITF